MKQSDSLTKSKSKDRLRYNEKTSSLEGKDAGDSQDLRYAHLFATIDGYHTKAESSFAQAIYNHTLGKHKEAKQEIQDAIDQISRAFWWSEDTDIEEREHNALHKIAKWKRDNFGCYLKLEDGEYRTYCPIRITHKKVGFSIGTTGDVICSICRKDASECVHRSDRSYWIRGGKGQEGKCTVCSEKKCTIHIPDYLYRITPSRILTNQVLHEVSMVRKPASPESRLSYLPISRKELEASIGAMDDGMKYVCSACSSCPGFTEVDLNP